MGEHVLERGGAVAAPHQQLLLCRADVAHGRVPAPVVGIWNDGPAVQRSHVLWRIGRRGNAVLSQQRIKALAKS